MSTHWWYIIKVSDILHNLWVKDTLKFSNKFSTFLPQIQDPWMSFTVLLIWLSDDQLIVEITDINAPLKQTCDYCGKDYIYTFTNKIIQTKAYLWEKDDDQFELEIDKKNKTINLEKWLCDNIQIEIPVVNMCKKCQKKWREETEELPKYNSVIWKSN